MVTVQHRIILNTFNKQCTKTIQDDILFVSNFRRVFSNFDDRNLSSPGQARFNRFPFVHHSITHSCLNYLHSNAMIFVNNVFFCLLFKINLSVSCLETDDAFFVIASFVFFLFGFFFYWVKLKICGSEFREF